MKVRMLLLTVALCFAGTALSFAQSPQMGTWKLDEAKSKIPAGFMKNSTVVYAADGDNVKVTTDGTTGDGKPLHTDWTGKFDGKEYPLTGDPTADSRSYKQINEHTLELANKKSGKVTASGRVVVSEDGKTRTLHLTGIDSSGKKVSGVQMYDKQ
jgi:endonuclease YncB( thermonuclease family)